MCVSTHMCLCVFACRVRHACLSVCVYPGVPVHTRTGVGACMHACMHAKLRAHVRTCLYTLLSRIFACTCPSVSSIHTTRVRSSCGIT